MKNLGLEHTDDKLLEICKKSINADVILKQIRNKNVKTAILGTDDFEILFPNKIRELDNCDNLYVVGNEYSASLKKINPDKLTKEFELIYLGVKIGGIKELNIFKKYPNIINNIAAFSAPVHDSFAETIIKTTPKLIEPYFDEKRKIKHSLIILSGMNNANSLQAMLKSFKAYTKPAENTEVIVVINGSQDKSINIPSEILTFKYNIKVINTPKNLGISGGYNEGIRIARGEYISLMQDDITFKQKTWLEELEFYLDNYPNIGLIGGFRGGYYFKNDTKKDDNFASPYISKGSQLIGKCKWKLLQDYVVKVDSVNCMLVMFRKEMGLYNEYLLPNGIEDIEFAFKVRKKGYGVYVTDVGITHGELLSTTRQETKLDLIKDFIIKKITGKNKKQTKHTLARRLSRAYHFQYFKEKYSDLLREIPNGVNFDKLTLDVIAENEHKISRSEFKESYIL